MARTHIGGCICLRFTQRCCIYVNDDDLVQTALLLAVYVCCVRCVNRNQSTALVCLGHMSIKIYRMLAKNFAQPRLVDGEQVLWRPLH